MLTMTLHRNISCLLLIAAVAFSACSDDEEYSTSQGLGLGSGSSDSGDKAKDGEGADAEDEVTAFIYTDEDFSELDVQNRDPFRAYAKAFKAQAAAPAQRRVLMPGTSLDEMKLIAIVTGMAQPRAMLTDTAKVGHVIRRGDYIGRPEVVQTGGAEGMPVTLNWRVDRIRAGSVVLTREDPTAPDKPPLTRIMPLHEGEERR